MDRREQLQFWPEAAQSAAERRIVVTSGNGGRILEEAERWFLGMHLRGETRRHGSTQNPEPLKKQLPLALE